MVFAISACISKEENAFMRYKHHNFKLKQSIRIRDVLAMNDLLD